MSDYSTISNPYDNQLGRQSDSAIVAGPTSQEMAQQSDSSSYVSTSGGAGTPIGTGSTGVASSGGSTEDTAVKSAGTISDLWINSFIRSTNWLPKKSGFYIDGQNGYAEFSNVFISGGITATTGTVGGFQIGPDYIRDVANSMGLASTVTGGDDVRFWAGDTFTNRAIAPFRVTESGSVTGSNINITGGSITGAGIVSVVALNLANRGWTQTCAFSITDADTIAWGSGNFVTADGGTTLSISAGNTGNMAAKTYIYLDANVSLTVYQTTTTASTAVGASKVLIAVAQNGTVEATYQVLSGQGGQNIDASSIVANSITANELSTSITYAGAIIIDTAGMIRSGQTAYDTGTGWFIGNVSGTPKLSIGNSSGNKLTWDGTNLSVSGRIRNVAIRAYTNFEGSGRFTTTSSNLTPTFNTSGLQMTTSAGSTSYGKNVWFLSQKMFSKSPIYSCRMELNTGAGSKGEIFFGVGDMTTAVTGHDFTAAHAGFYITLDAGTVTLGRTHNNGTTRTNSLFQTLGSSLSLYTLDLCVVLDSDSNIGYYYRLDSSDTFSLINSSTLIPASSLTMNKMQFSAVCNDVSGSGGGWGTIFIASSYES